MPALIVPYHPSDQARADAWAFVRGRLRSDFPDWPIIVPHIRPWSKTAAVNAGVRWASEQVLILHDADSFVPADALQQAVHLVQQGKADWVVPHGLVYRLSRGATDGWLNHGTDTIRLCRSVYQGPAGGGIVVLSRRAFDAVNGMDERFDQWGWEDQAFGRALGTLVGPYHRIDTADLIHLWHPPAVDTGRPAPEMKALYQRYKAATFVPRLMRALVFRTDPEPWVALDRPRIFEAAGDHQVIRYGDKVAHFDVGRRLSTRDPDLADAMVGYRYVQEVDGRAES